MSTIVFPGNSFVGAQRTKTAAKRQFPPCYTIPIINHIRKLFMRQVTRPPSVFWDIKGFLIDYCRKSDGDPSCAEGLYLDGFTFSL